MQDSATGPCSLTVCVRARGHFLTCTRPRPTRPPIATGEEREIEGEGRGRGRGIRCTAWLPTRCMRHAAGIRMPSILGRTRDRECVVSV